MSKDKVLLRKCFIFDSKANGGESLSLTTEWIDSGDKISASCDGVYINQTLTLESYGNSASFNLSGTTLTPENLRMLANELESSRNKAVFEKSRVQSLD